MTFVLIISFILHAFSIFAMIILYLRQNQYKQAEQAMEKLQKDVEAVLQSFLMEIQEENKQLAETVNKQEVNHQNSAHEEAPEASSAIEKVKVHPSVSSVKKAYQSVSGQEQNDIAVHYEPPMPDVSDQLELSVAAPENKDEKLSFKEALESQLKQQTVQSTEEQTLEMKKKGYNIEDIAKKLGKGKTEIELLLKFHS